MSEQEFEVYLRLLARLLRLSDAQRELIADELRDHMEARLEELMRQGHTREAAIHAALDEFGDAAGLADRFTRIARQRLIRRRIMQTSIGTIAAAAVIALTFLYLLPQNRPGVPGPSSIHADEAEQITELSAAPIITAGEFDPVLEKLVEPVPVDFDAAELKNVIDYFRNITDINFFVNWPALEQVGVSQDAPIMLQLHDIGCDTALTLMLRSLSTRQGQKLEYTVQDGVVVISTSNDINHHLTVRIYDCLDLIAESAYSEMTPEAEPSARAPGPPGVPGGYPGGYPGAGGYGGGYPGGGGYGMASEPGPRSGLGRTTRGRASAVTWVASGQGNRIHELASVVAPLLENGSVTIYDDMLIVRAKPTVHRQIQETLALLRQALAEREAQEPDRIPE